MIKTFLLSATALAFTVVGTQTASAAAGDLAKCYDRVISSCNATKHPGSCSENGMNQCDEIHPTPLVTGQLSLTSSSTAPNTRR